ncbi:MAG TPA: OsmC family protein [Dehalococcoidia bacterium]|nr:OsmC family protein [Dehalococcoidia bacterium]
MNAEVIQQTVTLWSSDPAKAAARPTVKAVSEGSGAAVEAGAFSWRAGLPPALGGDNSAPSPTLLLLSALAGCAVVLIRDTLGPQLGVEVEAVEATVRCETESPDLRDLGFELRITSQAGDAAIARLLAVWEER